MTSSRLHNDFPAAVLFILPSFIGFFIFLLVPIFSTMLLSFTNYSGSFARTAFIGLKNYATVVKDPNFWKSVRVTGVFVFFSTVCQLFLGFSFALILNRRLKGTVFFRSVFFLPVILSSVAICLSFVFIFHPSKGPVNMLLESMHLPRQPWLSGKSTALMTVIFVFIWQSFGYYMIIFLSGLQTINADLYEVADIDGATNFQKLYKITIPGLSPVIFFSTIIAIINAFKSFDNIFIMTGGQYGGGPARATHVLSFDIYQKGFIFWQVGYGAAESVILFCIVMLITVIQIQMQKRWVNFDVV